MDQVERAAPRLGRDPRLQVARAARSSGGVAQPTLELAGVGAGVGDPVVDPARAVRELPGGVVAVALGHPAADLLLALHDELADVVEEAQVVGRVGVRDLQRPGDLGGAHRLSGQQRQDAQPHGVCGGPQPSNGLGVGLVVHLTLQEFLGSESARTAAARLSNTSWGVFAGIVQWWTVVRPPRRRQFATGLRRRASAAPRHPAGSPRTHPDATLTPPRNHVIPAPGRARLVAPQGARPTKE